MSEIKAYFNAREATDEGRGHVFAGIEGETSPDVIKDLPAFLKAAGRDYGILKKAALVRDAFGGVDDNGNVCETVREVENQFHLVRTHDGCVVSPSTVTGQYAPLTLLDIAAEIQPWLNAGWVTPDAVYSGKNESLELLCLRMDAQGDLDEPFEHYIIFHNPHATGGKCKGRIMSFRRQCSNSFTSIGRGYEFTVGHRISATLTPEEQQLEMLKRAKESAQAWQTAQNYLTDLNAKIQGWQDYVLGEGVANDLTRSLLGITDMEKASKRALKRYDAIISAFNMPQFGTYGLTAYDWYNAVTFVNSSPNSETVQNSKVSPVARMIRNTDPNGSGYKLELKAENILNRYMANN